MLTQYFNNEETAKRIRKEDRTYRRSKLLGRFTAKMLYGWDDKRFDKEYLRKIENNWR